MTRKGTVLNSGPATDSLGDSFPSGLVSLSGPK